MASLLGVNVDRTISLTFVIGAALAAVAGMMVLLYYGLIDFFIGFLAGIKAFTAAVLGGIGSLPGAMLGGLLIGLIEVFWSGYFSVDYKDVAAFGILVTGADLPADRPARPTGDREGLSRWRSAVAVGRLSRIHQARRRRRLRHSGPGQPAGRHRGGQHRQRPRASRPAIGAVVLRLDRRRDRLFPDGDAEGGAALVPLVVGLAMIVLFAVLEWREGGGSAAGRSAALRFLGGQLGRDAGAAVAGAALALAHAQARGQDQPRQDRRPRARLHRLLSARTTSSSA